MSSTNQEEADHDQRQKAAAAVFVPTKSNHNFNIKVEGYDWSKGLDYEKIVASYLTTGFQATSFGLAVQEINKMVVFKINICKII